MKGYNKCYSWACTRLALDLAWLGFECSDEFYNQTAIFNKYTQSAINKILNIKLDYFHLIQYRLGDGSYRLLEVIVHLDIILAAAESGNRRTKDITDFLYGSNRKVYFLTRLSNQIRKCN